MQGPQLIFELSNSLLTHAFHNGIGVLQGCPDLNAPQFVTAINIKEIVPFRGDDPDSANVLNAIASQFRQIEQQNPNIMFPVSPQPQQRQGVRTAGDLNNALLQETNVFFLVSGDAFQFTSDQLDRQGTSDDEQFHIAFDRTFTTSQLDQHHLPALLLQLSSVTLDASTETLTFHLQFVSLFSPFVLAGLLPPDQTQLIVQAIVFLQQKLGDIPLRLPLGASLSALDPSTSVVNRGITTESVTSDVPIARGIRVAFDLVPPDDATGWRAFHEHPQPFSFQQTSSYHEEWTASASGEILAFLAEQAAGKALKPVKGINFGPGRAVVQAGWNGSALLAQAPVFSGDLDVGTITLTAIPSLGQASTAGAPTPLHLQLCVNFTVDVGAGILEDAAFTILGVLVGALVAGFPGAVIGGIIGAVVGFAGDIGVSAGVPQAVGQIFGSKPLPIDCGELLDNCRDCDVTLDTSLANLGDLRLRRVTTSLQGLQLAGSIDWIGGQGDALLPIGLMQLESRFGWGFPWTACETSVDPSKPLSLTNTGALPLLVCQPKQRPVPGQADNILDVTVQTTGQPAGFVGTFPLTLGPGQAVPLIVHARISRRPDYRSDLPLPLRILSGGGARVIDVNAGGAAVPEDPARALADALLASRLCHLLTLFPGRLIRIWRFPDPVPFRPGDQVRERLTVGIASLPNGLTIQGVDAAGRLHGQSVVNGGKALLDLSLELVPASSHETAQLFMQVAGDPALGNSQPLPVSGPINSPSLLRILYRQGPLYPVNGAIRGAVRIDQYLALLTEEGLFTNTVAVGHLGTWQGRQIDAPVGLTGFGKQLIVATAQKLIGFDVHTRIRWQHEGGFRTLAAQGKSLWVADDLNLIELRAEEEKEEDEDEDEHGHLHEHRRIGLAHIDQLLAVGDDLFALARRHVWYVNHQGAHDLSIEADQLSEVSGLPLAVRHGAAIVFDRDGLQHAEYATPPWSASVIEWPNVAVELRHDAGLVIHYDRYETLFAIADLPRDIQEQLDNLPLPPG